MPTKLTPAQLAISLNRRARNLQRQVRASEKETLDAALGIARQLSSGPYTAKMLRQMGHPYSRRDPNPPADPTILNVSQAKGTERLRDSWRIRGPFNTSSGLRSYLVNLASYSGLVGGAGGTRHMIPRPIILRIQNRVKDRRYRSVLKAVLAGLSED